MQELDLLRRTDRQHAQKAVGVMRGGNLLTKAEVANAQADSDVARLPEDVTADCELQSAGGGWLFMVDVSSIDGPDPIQ